MLMLFLTVALVHIVALMSPGPDFFFVSQTAVSRSRKEAMMGVLGITMGVMVWAAVALLGLNLILAKMAWLHNIIMVGGGLYLCWMGYQMLRGALKKEEKKPEEPKVELATAFRAARMRLTKPARCACRATACWRQYRWAKAIKSCSMK